ncbi:4-pyridoxate dehydrogenase-like [Anthonomus grandis grandis]|uniref:4-pyridoxate dehydrogenase-like n=1 Tax=Anthonomus grandis grandis TaxID=2921223 RepID=UPI0021660E17|nr:4-pyridoxate dehydrogenase-like [Anthonomus grandis grandis]
MVLLTLVLALIAVKRVHSGDFFPDFSPDDFHDQYEFPAAMGFIKNESELYSPYVYNPLFFDDKLLTDEIARVISNYRHYVLPVNNDQYYQPSYHNGDSCADHEKFDFIIVGTGTAGGVLANRLTEEKYTVLALEAGDEAPTLTNMLGMNIYMHQSGINWGYNTTKQKFGCLGSRNQACAYPRGHVLGGSSVINFGMYVRGNRLDFDKWEALGNPGWSYDDVLPYFRKPEHATFTDNIDREYHGFDGPQRTGIPDDIPLISEAILKGHREIGKRMLDYNGEDQDGVSRLQFFIDRNVRASTAHAFLNPIRHRKNLKVSTNSYVTKILIADKTAYGVEYVKNGKTCIALAKKEVLLAAGSINSPQILMLSGIGPAQELYRHGIDIIQDLPVGRNMQDHLFFPGVFYRTPHKFYDQSISEHVKLWTQNKRPLTPSLGQTAISFFNFEGPEGSQPEIELFFFGPPLLTSDLAYVLGFDDAHIEAFRNLNGLTDFCVNIELLHPRSRGTVTLQSKDPRDWPLIDTNYFSDPEQKDIENMYLGVLAALQLNDTRAFKEIGAEFLVIPFPDCDWRFEQLSKEWWYCALRSIATTLFHPIGTTSMGPDPKTSVVNHQLKVHGINKLRVVDAGIMPEHISGHPNAAVVMIAEKISDEIKKEHSDFDSFSGHARLYKK